MPYLNLDPNYFDHRKTMRLIGLLGPDADVLPLRLWAYAAKHHPKDGRLEEYTDPELEAIMRWRGSPGAAVAAMMKVGYLRALTPANGYECADWLQHEGHLEWFARRAKMAADARWHKKDATSIARSNAPSVPSVPTVPDITTAAGAAKGASGGHSNGETSKSDQELLAQRFPYGKLKGVVIANMPVDQAEFLLRTESATRMGRAIKAGLEARIAMKRAEAAGDRGGGFTNAGGAL